jgi:hypothetical protein
MPHDLYLLRLIHHATRGAFPCERLWTAGQLIKEAIVRLSYFCVCNRDFGRICDRHNWVWMHERIRAGLRAGKSVS